MGAQRPVCGCGSNCRFKHMKQQNGSLPSFVAEHTVNVKNCYKEGMGGSEVAEVWTDGKCGQEGSEGGKD